VIDVALEAALGGPRRDSSHATLMDRLAAQRAERLGGGGSTIHQDELHVAPPHATQNSVRRLRSLDGAAGGSYCHQALRLGLIPFFLLYSFRQHVMSQLQMRSLHRKFITEPLRLEILSNSHGRRMKRPNGLL
jgi:hypothetical protein